MTPECRAEIEKMLEPVRYNKVPPLTISDQLVVRELLAEIDRLQSRIDSISPLLYDAALHDLIGQPYHSEQIQWREMYTQLTGKQFDWQREIQRHHGLVSGS